MKNLTLDLLLIQWNRATAPYVLRNDHEHHRNRQLARAIDNRLRRLGFFEDVHWTTSDHTGRRYIGTFIKIRH